MLWRRATDLDEDRLADAYADAIQDRRGIRPVACDALQGGLDAIRRGRVHLRGDLTLGVPRDAGRQSPAPPSP